MTTERTETLDDLRRDIDRIDDLMHRLLMERGAIIDRLVAVKRTAETGSAFRPGREADMMRRLVERHHGRLPFSAIEHIWRVVISTFTHVQAPYRVHVDQSSDSAAMRDVARFQMGFDVPIVMHDGAVAVAGAVSRSAGDLGIVAMGSTPRSWWDDLGHDGGPQVMARLPFLTYPGRPAAHPVLIVAKPLGDAAIDEVVIGAVERPTRPTSGALGRAEMIAEVAGTGRWRGLIAGERADLPEDARIVGGYARPMNLAQETKALFG